MGHPQHVTAKRLPRNDLPGEAGRTSSLAQPSNRQRRCWAFSAGQKRFPCNGTASTSSKVLIHFEGTGEQNGTSESASKIRT